MGCDAGDGAGRLANGLVVAQWDAGGRGWRKRDGARGVARGSPAQFSTCGRRRG